MLRFCRSELLAALHGRVDDDGAQKEDLDLWKRDVLQERVKLQML